MKTCQTVLIGGLMAFSLAACSSTGTSGGNMGSSGASMSAGSTSAGSSTAASANGADNGAGAGGSNNATNGAVPVTPPTLDGANPPPNVPSGTATNGVDAGAGNR